MLKVAQILSKSDSENATVLRTIEEELDDDAVLEMIAFWQFYNVNVNVEFGKTSHSFE